METTQIEDQLRDMICQVSGLPHDFDRDGHLYLDLGVASMHALQLLTEIEDRYGIQLPDDEFVEATSLAKIGGLVVRVVSS